MTTSLFPKGHKPRFKDYAILISWCKSLHFLQMWSLIETESDFQQVNVSHTELYRFFLKGDFAITQTTLRKETNNSNKPVINLHLTHKSESSKPLILGGKGKSMALV